MCVCVLFLFILLPDISCSYSTSWASSTTKYFTLPCTYHLSLVSSASCLNPFKPPPPRGTLLLIMPYMHTDIVMCTYHLCHYSAWKSMQYLPFSFWITSPSITISSSTLFVVRGIISFSVSYNVFWSHPSFSYPFNFVFFFSQPSSPICAAHVFSDVGLFSLQRLWAILITTLIRKSCLYFFLLHCVSLWFGFLDGDI